MGILNALKPVFTKAGWSKVGKALWSKPAKITYGTLAAGTALTAGGIFAYQKYYQPAEVPPQKEDNPVEKQETDEKVEDKKAESTQAEEEKEVETEKKDDKKADSKKSDEAKDKTSEKEAEKEEKPEDKKSEDTQKTEKKQETEKSKETDKTDKKEDKTEENTESVHTVKRGDNVWNIAKAQLKKAHKDEPDYKPTNAEIAKLTNELIKINNLHYEPDNYVVIIQPGQKLKLSA